ncbi:MAG: molybdopterin molybdotransferase MoeA [Kineosporiaceae bacterium]|nr:molybdopterin molybdotransferase MoeA [Kineosporiaceae bacterium]
MSLQAEGGAECSWPVARSRATSTVAPVRPEVVPLSLAAGTVLAESACARSDLPAMDTSAMDGWAVCGPPPWRVVAELLAGHHRPAGVVLTAGEAVRIATGAGVPPGASAVLRSEHAESPSGSPNLLWPKGSPPEVGADIRLAGGECRRGDVVLVAGTPIGAVALGLLAAAGLDEVVARRVRADVLVLGDELLTRGPARDGRLRDALGPLLSAWLPARGAEIASRRRVPDTVEALAAALAGCSGDVVVTTGSTARGPVDHLHGVLDRLGARLVVDGVAVRPGHPQLLALLPDGRPLVGLPGNPLAAVSGLMTLFDPLARTLRGLDVAPVRHGVLSVDVPAGPDATRLMPVRGGRPVMFAGPAMLRGSATADAVAVIPPGGVPAGGEVELLELP